MNTKDTNYKIKDDIYTLIENNFMTIDDLASEIGISRNTLYEVIENGYTTKDIYEKVYSYIYKSGLRLNTVKEDFLKETNQNIILFHGSKNGLDNIIVNGSRNDCDFGLGFYLGESYSQALSFVCENKDSSIYSFMLNLKGLNVLKFDCSLEWMLTICYFRGTLKEYSNYQLIKKLVEKIENADIIIAPIADNKMFYIMSLFSNGDINSEVALHSLAASKLGLQYVLKTDKSLNNLVLLEKYYICLEEKQNAISKLLDRSHEIDTKLKLAKREFKEGKYIEEILK